MPATPDISPDLNSLDAGTLRAMVLAQRQELASQREQLLARDTQIEHLKLLIIQLRRMQFGRKSEKLDRKIEQLELHLEDLEARRAEVSLPVVAAPAGVWAERSWPPAQGAAKQAVAGVDADVMLDELARASDAPTQAEKRRAKALKQTGAGPDSASQLALNELTNGKPDTALVLMERAADLSVASRAPSCCICLN